MARRQKKQRRDDHVKAKVATTEGVHATVVPGVTDEDPNTGRRIEKKPKK